MKNKKENNPYQTQYSKKSIKKIQIVIIILLIIAIIGIIVAILGSKASQKQPVSNQQVQGNQVASDAAVAAVTSQPNETATPSDTGVTESDNQGDDGKITTTLDGVTYELDPNQEVEEVEKEYSLDDANIKTQEVTKDTSEDGYEYLISKEGIYIDNISLFYTTNDLPENILTLDIIEKLQKTIFDYIQNQFNSIGKIEKISIEGVTYETEDNTIRFWVNLNSSTSKYAGFGVSYYISDNKIICW